MKVRKLFLIAFVLLGIAACSDDETSIDDPVQEQALVNLDIKSTLAGEISQQSQQRSRFDFRSGSITIEDLIFRISNGEDTYEVDVLQGMDSLFSINLLNGVPNGVLDYFSIPTGEFEQIEVELITGEEQSVITGVFFDASGEEYPIEVILPEGEPIVLNTTGDFIFLESRPVEAEVVLNPRSWVSRLTGGILNRLDTNEDGVIVISDTMNSDLLHLILEFLQESSEVDVKREFPA